MTSFQTTLNQNRKATQAIFVLGVILLIYGIYLMMNPEVKIEWTTETELDTYGFNLLRQDGNNLSPESAINPQMIIARGSPIDGATYQYIDRDVQSGENYKYLLQEVTTSNQRDIIETMDVTVAYRGLKEMGFSLVILALAIYLNQQMRKSH